MAGYGSDEGFATWLADNGLTLPVGAPTPAVLRNRGSAWLDATYGSRMTCYARAGGADQERLWPVAGHAKVASDAIPIAWVQASYRAAYLHATTAAGGLGGLVNANQRVQKQKVDVIERTFFDNGGTKAGEVVGVIDTEIDGMVAPYLCSLTANLGIRAIGS